MTQKPDETSGSSSKTVTYIGILVVVIIVVAIAIYLLLSGGQGAPGTSPGPGPEQPQPTSPSGGTPNVQIVSVTADQDVTVEASNFPSNEELVVRIGKTGNEGKDGIQVGTTNSGSSGSFTATYDIPSEFYGESLLIIRLESGSGYFAYHSFNNQ